MRVYTNVFFTDFRCPTRVRDPWRFSSSLCCSASGCEFLPYAKLGARVQRRPTRKPLPPQAFFRSFIRLLPLHIYHLQRHCGRLLSYGPSCSVPSPLQRSCISAPHFSQALTRRQSYRSPPPYSIHRPTPYTDIARLQLYPPQNSPRYLSTRTNMTSHPLSALCSQQPPKHRPTRGAAAL